MGYGFHFYELAAQRCFCKLAAIACCANGPQARFFRNAVKKLYKKGDERLQRIPVVPVVRLLKHCPFVVNKDAFDGGRS